jgi:hypothetical protein
MMASKRSVALTGVDEGAVGVSSPQPAQNDTTMARRAARRMIPSILSDAGQASKALVRAASPAYFRCLFTSFVISNMLTDDLPPNTAFSVLSALIIRLFFLSCSPFFLM